MRIHTADRAAKTVGPNKLYDFFRTYETCERTAEAFSPAATESHRAELQRRAATSPRVSSRAAQTGKPAEFNTVERTYTNRAVVSSLCLILILYFPPHSTEFTLQVHLPARHWSIFFQVQNTLKMHGAARCFVLWHVGSLITQFMQREMLVLSSFFLFLNETSRPGDYLLCDLRLEGVKKVCCCFVLFCFYVALYVQI